jgi:hypothetical protein
MSDIPSVPSVPPVDFIGIRRSAIEEAIPGVITSDREDITCDQEDVTCDQN